MSDDLVYKILVELAVIEGKREPGGKWLVSDPQEVARLLKRAFAVVARAAAAIEEDGAAAPAKKSAAK